MNDLSIIISYKKDYIIQYLELLKPILKAYDTELIIISNENIEDIIPYKYNTLKFDQDFKNFKDFCISSSLGKRVMIIDSGIQLSNDFISFILDNLEKDTYFNISCSVKSFLSSDKTESYLHDEVILYNRGINGFNKHYTKETIMDYSFIESNLDQIDMYINKLIKNRLDNEIFIWFSKYITNLTYKNKAYCYTRLELIKSTIPDTDWNALNTLFINSDTNNVYSEFLLCQKGYLSGNMNFLDIIERLKRIKITSADIYFSWLLKDFINLRKNSLELLSYFKEKVLRNCIIYLLQNDSTSWDYVSNFILDTTSSLINHEDISSITNINRKELSTLIKIIVVSLEYMNNNINTPKQKDIILNIFDLYTVLGNKLIIQNIFPKSSAIMNLKLEKEMIINVNKFESIDDSISILTNLCKSHLKKSNLFRYYIQKLRQNNNKYTKPLGICMIIKDEEKNLVRCLSSIKPLIDNGLAELNIVDTGSVDSSVTIAHNYTDKIYIHKWENNFSKARNQSVMYCDAEYIFIIDADEELIPSEISSLEKIFSTPNYKEYNAFSLNIISYTDKNLVDYAIMPQPRIFKNTSSFYYSSSVHNQPIYNDPIMNLDIDVLHYGYIMTPEIREKKFKRTSTLLKKELQNNPNSVYFNYQLATSYAMYRDLKNALRQVEIYMRLISEEFELYDNVLMYYNNAAAVYINCYSYEKAEKVCNSALAIEPNFIDFVYYKAFILFEHEDYKNSLLYLNKYLDLINDYNKLDVDNNGRFAFYTICSHEEVKKKLLQTHYRLGMYNDCINDIYSINSESVMINYIYEFMNSCIITGNTSKLENFYSKYINNSSNKLFSDTFHFFENVLQKDYPKNEFYKLDKYSWDELDFDSFKPFLDTILPEILALNIEDIVDEKELIKYKKILQLILHRTDNLLYFYITDEELVDIFNMYMFICSRFTTTGKYELLEVRELAFIAIILKAYNTKDSNQAIEFFKDAAIEYHEMSGIVNFSIDILFSSSSKDKIDNIVSKSNIDKDDNNITSLIENITNDIQMLDTNSICTDQNETPDIVKIKSIVTYLEKYKYILPVQIYLCKLYCLIGEYKKAIEAYCYLKLNVPSEISVEIEKLIPHIPLTTDKNNLKILHGTMDNTENTTKTVSILKQHGIDAKSLNYVSRQCKYPSDYEMDLNSFENGKIILDRTIDATAKLISEYDIFHFYYGSTINFNHDDLQIIKDLNKKIIVQFSGQEVRTSEKAKQLGCHIQIPTKNDIEIVKKLELFSKYASCCIVNDYESYEYVKNYFNNIKIIAPFVKPPILTNKSYYPKKKNANFTIVHSPQNRIMAGTEYLLKAIEELKPHYNFDFTIIDNIPLDQAQKIYQSADLVIDNLLVGTYSEFAVEAMAVGKPVIAYISDFMKNKYPEELPIIKTTHDNFKANLENILKNKDTLSEIGKSSYNYVQKYHNMDVEISKLIELYYLI